MNASRLAVVFASVLAFAPAVGAVAPDPRLSPDYEIYNSGFVTSIVEMSDGSVVIGGEFTRVGDVERINLARIFPDGTVDPDWGARIGDESSQVLALARDAQERVYVGGVFTTVDGVPARYLVRLTAPNGILDAGWLPDPNLAVTSIAIDSNGLVFACGVFSSIGGLPRNSMAKLSASGSGTADPFWNPGVACSSVVLADPTSVFALGSSVAKLSRGGSGAPVADWTPPVVAPGQSFTAGVVHGSNIYLAGHATAFPSSTGFLAKVDAQTGEFDPAWTFSSDAPVIGLAVDSAGRAYVGGDFSMFGGIPRARLAKVDTVTAQLDPNWNPSCDRVVGFEKSQVGALSLRPINVLHVDAADRVLAGGAFTYIGGGERLSFARLEGALGSASPSPPEVFSIGSVHAIAPRPAGGYAIGGQFKRVGGVTRHHLFRVDALGQLDMGWDPRPDNQVDAVTVDATDVTYVAGEFGNIGGAARPGLAKVLANGLASSWSPPAFDERIYDVQPDATGRLYVVGVFNHVGGQPRKYLARLDANGSLDSWAPAPNLFVSGVVVDSPDSVVVAGYFSAIGGESISSLARLSSTTALAYPGWGNYENSLFSIDASPDGFIYALAVASPRIVRFVSGTGQADSTWSPSLPPVDWDKLRAASGGVAYVVGDSTGISIVERITPTGSDPNWSPEFDDRGVFDIDIGNGDLIAGGAFAAVEGFPRISLARIPLSSPPIVSAIPDQVLQEDGATAPLPFTVSDAESSDDALPITVLSSNTALVPPSGIALGGNATSRTIALTPLPNASGSTTISITATDETGTHNEPSETFTLQVVPVNDLPTLTIPSAQSLTEDAATLQLQLQVGDVETPVNQLQVVATSSDTTLFPPGSLVLGGATQSRLLSITPSPNRNGVATISVGVNDGTATTTKDFQVTVVPVPDQPFLSVPSNQVIDEDDNTGALAIIVVDADTLSGSSVAVVGTSNPALVGLANAVVSYDAQTGNGTITVTPVANANGTATLTLRAEDADLLESNDATFVVTVNPVNDVPMVSQPANIGAGFLEDTVRAVPVTVGDVETPPGSLLVAARILSINNPELFPAGSLAITNGAAPNARTLTLTPAANQSGQATLELEVEDAEQAKSQSVFTVRVTPVTDDPDLVVAIDDARATIAPGATDTWTITVRNDGIDTVSGVQLVHVPSPGVAIVGFTCAGANGGVCHAASGNGALGTVSIQLAPGGSVTYVVTASVTATDGSISYSIEAKPPAGLMDTQPSNNVDVDTTNVTQVLFGDGFE